MFGDVSNFHSFINGNCKQSKVNKNSVLAIREIREGLEGYMEERMLVTAIAYMYSELQSLGLSTNVQTSYLFKMVSSMKRQRNIFDAVASRCKTTGISDAMLEYIRKSITNLKSRREKLIELMNSFYIPSTPMKDYEEMLIRSETTLLDDILSNAVGFGDEGNSNMLKYVRSILSLCPNGEWREKLSKDKNKYSPVSDDWNKYNESEKLKGYETILRDKQAILNKEVDRLLEHYKQSIITLQGGWVRLVSGNVTKFATVTGKEPRIIAVLTKFSRKNNIRYYCEYEESRLTYNISNATILGVNDPTPDVVLKNESELNWVYRDMVF